MKTSLLILLLALISGCCCTLQKTGVDKTCYNQLVTNGKVTCLPANYYEN